MPLSPANVKFMTVLEGLGIKPICEMTADEARAAEALDAVAGTPA